MYKILLSSSILGYLSYNFLSNYMYVGNKAIIYYSEAHLTEWNSLIHTFFMPISMLGLLLIIPVIFKLKPVNSKKLMYSLYFFYGGHYMNINIKVSLLYYFIYYFIVKNAIKIYNLLYLRNIKYILILGIILFGGGLTIQEIIGHYIGGDIASRYEGIPNAILYAKYYSVAYILKYLN